MPGAVEYRRFRIEGGPSVILAPCANTRDLAIVTIMPVGELHDPADRSGRTQLALQLLATGAAGGVPARSDADARRRYPNGWSAATYADHSVIGFVVAPERLQRELEELAARLTDLRLTDQDLDRERQRLERRVRSMHGEHAGYAAMHLARQAVSPLPEGASAGGVPEQAARLSLPELREFLRRAFAPADATIVLAGAFDPADAERRLRALFPPSGAVGTVEAGAGAPPSAPAARPAPAGPLPIQQRRIVVAPPLTPTTDRGAPDAPAAAGAEGRCAVAIAVRPPALDGADSAAYILLAARLRMLEEREGWFEGADAPSFLTLFLDPTTPFVFIRPCGGDPAAALEAMERRLTGVAEMSAEEFQSLKESLLEGEGWMTGEAAIGAAVIAANPYGAAYALGRHAMLGIDPAARASALRALERESLAAAAKRIFDSARCSRAIVTEEVKASPSP